MKRKRLFLAIAALLAAGGLWLAQWRSRSNYSAPPKSKVEAAFEKQSDGSKPGKMLQPADPDHTLNRQPRLAPPNPTRRFVEFTPEQRVEFARRGHGPGG